jgi:ubiquinone/menaquinone biosynthesis C-methylase UbiE
MSARSEGDYVLGTHAEELARLGLQHRVWRPVVLECWQKAGIAVGSCVLDVGAGPGYATVDLAEIVGPTGHVDAVERSSNFVNAIKTACGARSLSNVQVHELDLMSEELPCGPYDFTWCRWVLCFVSNPELLVKKIAAVTHKGGRAIFHEYGHYTTWRFFPRRAVLEEFVGHVVATWRESGGEPDTGLQLPSQLTQNGFHLRSVTPHVFCLRPNDYMWQWPAQFIDVHLGRLQELGRIDENFAGNVRAELAAAENADASFMITPLVIEIVAEKTETPKPTSEIG